MNSNADAKKTRWRRALGFATPYRGAVLAILAITLLIAAANSAEPLILKVIFDALSTKNPLPLATRAILWLLLLGLLREAGSAASNWLTWRTRLGLHFNLLETTVTRLHRLPLNFHRTEGVGAIMTRLDRGIQGFIAAVSQILFNVFPAVLYLLITIVVMFRLDWHLAVVVLSFAPLPAIIAAFAAPEQTRRERSLMTQWERIYSRFNEVLSGIVTVRSFAMEDTEKSRFLGSVREANDIVERGVAVDTAFTAATNIVIALARITATAVGAYLVSRGQITIGTLIAFLGYVGGLFGPVQGLSGIYQTLQKASVSLDEIFGILDVQEMLGDVPGAKELKSIQGRIEFANVRFSYQRANRPVLNGVDIKIEPGETVALVGPSGSGKTTVFSLLMRFYDPAEGVVRIDDQDIRQIKQTSLRRAIGIVLQEPLLFNDTIRNNIAYGRPNASTADIERAARAANAHDFISRLPEGYATMAGERGASLSVGERQRITIARALIKDPPIILLDEATSALDPESEAVVQDALRQLMKGRTSFVIAHRLSTVVFADKIIVLRDGRIIEQGRHRDLMASDGYYASLVYRQTRGLLRNEGEDWQRVA